MSIRSSSRKHGKKFPSGINVLFGSVAKSIKLQPIFCQDVKISTYLCKNKKEWVYGPYKLEGKTILYQLINMCVCVCISYVCAISINILISYELKISSQVLLLQLSYSCIYRKELAIITKAMQTQRTIQSAF